MELPAKPECVAAARAAVREYVERHGLNSEDIVLAVSEAVTNTVVHGYRGSQQGRFLLTVHPNGDALIVAVEDSGAGMSPHFGSPGLRLGLPIIHQLAESVEVMAGRRGGTRLIMRFPYSR